MKEKEWNELQSLYQEMQALRQSVMRKAMPFMRNGSGHFQGFLPAQRQKLGLLSGVAPQGYPPLAEPVCPNGAYPHWDERNRKCFNS